MRYHDRVDEVLILNAEAELDTDEIRRRIVPLLRRHGVTHAYLIGSFARDSADAWSDVDLAIVIETQDPFVERPLQFTDVIHALPTAVDLLVYTPAEFQRGMSKGFGIFDIIEREGIRLL
jgi:predicted nucleotidyltransferase